MSRGSDRSLTLAARLGCAGAAASLGDPDLVMRQRLESVGGDQVIPLEPHAAHALDVQAGLDGDDVARRRGSRRSRGRSRAARDGRGPRPWPEWERKCGLEPRATRNGRGRRRRRRGPGVPGFKRASPAACADARLEQLALARRRPAADGERVGEVAPVAGDDHREVEQEQVARLDLPRRGRAAPLGRGARARRRSRRRRSPARPAASIAASWTTR